MQAIRIHAHGSTDQLKLDSIPEPILQSDEVLVKIKTAALNHLDLWVREGVPGIPLPLIMGSDGAGEIVDMGDSAQKQSNLKMGDPVILTPIRSCVQCSYCKNGQENLCAQFHIPGESVQGVQAEYVTLPLKYVLPKPESLSWAEAAALPLAAMTAYHMLFPKAGLKADQWVLIYGASSGVGSMAIQMAKAAGAKVITTVGSEAKAQLAEGLGADYIIDYKSQPIGKTVKGITAGTGADVVFEHTGLKTWNESLRSLSKGGKLVTCGATTGPIVKIDIRALFIKHQQIIGSTMGTLQDLKDILELVKAGKLKPVVDQVYKFQDIQDAHKRLENGQHFGKVVITFD